MFANDTQRENSIRKDQLLLFLQFDISFIMEPLSFIKLSFESFLELKIVFFEYNKLSVKHFIHWRCGSKFKPFRFRCRSNKSGWHVSLELILLIVVVWQIHKTVNLYKLIASFYSGERVLFE